MSGGYAPADFALSLQKIEASQLDYFVEGGQALNIWAEVYSAAAPGITDLAPFSICRRCGGSELESNWISRYKTGSIK